MAEIVQDLFDLFGLSAAPQNLGEFVPWFIGVCICIGIVLFVFRMFKAFVLSLSGGRFF